MNIHELFAQARINAAIKKMQAKRKGKHHKARQQRAIARAYAVAQKRPHGRMADAFRRANEILDRHIAQLVSDENIGLSEETKEA